MTMSRPQRQSLLFITTRAPWSSAAPAACTDLLLTAGVFEQQVSLAFLGDGVWQLQPGQDGSQLRQKTLADLFPALELYEVRQVYVEARALQTRGLRVDELLIPVQMLDSAGLRELLATHDRSLVF